MGGSTFKPNSMSSNSKNSNSGNPNPQMQSITKSFFELIKKGDIDSVLQEREKSGIDVVTIVDENSWS